MSVSNYIKECKYRLGGLKPFIYLIPKDTMKVDVKAKGVKVNFKPQDDCTIHKVKAGLVVYNQDETYNGRFRFNSTLEITINEMFGEPFFQCLKTLRENEFYIIIEDKEGTQYLINAELFTKLEYEYTFTDATDQQNACVLRYSNLSNHPLLIMEEMLTETNILLDDQCAYNIGHSMKLWLTERDKINVNDDGVKATALYVENAEYLKTIEFLPQSFNYNEIYNGKNFQTNLSFSIPLESYQYYWSYDLIEFKDNVYGGIFHTTNNNYIVMGAENGLFPKYYIETSEEDGTPNLVTFEFTAVSQYPTLWTDTLRMFKWVDGGKECFGYNRYAMLKQQYSDDFGENWSDTVPEVKKKNELIEPEINSEACGYEIKYRWVDNGIICVDDSYYAMLLRTNDFICENGNKYSKCEMATATTIDGEYLPTREYVKGDLIEEHSDECTYITSRWVDTEETECIPVDESCTRVETEERCVGTQLVRYDTEYVTHNCSDYYNNGTESEVIDPTCCECGYKETRNVSKAIFGCGDRLGTQYNVYYDMNWQPVVDINKYELYQVQLYCPTGGTQYEQFINEYRLNLIEENCCECGGKRYEYRISNYGQYQWEGNIILGDTPDTTKGYEKWYKWEICEDVRTDEYEWRECPITYSTYKTGVFQCGKDLYMDDCNVNKYQKFGHRFYADASEGSGRVMLSTEKYSFWQLYEENSYDCGYKTAKWREAGSIVCINDMIGNNIVVVDDIETDVIFEESDCNKPVTSMTYSLYIPSVWNVEEIENGYSFKVRQAQMPYNDISFSFKNVKGRVVSIEVTEWKDSASYVDVDYSNGFVAVYDNGMPDNSNPSVQLYDNAPTSVYRTVVTTDDYGVILRYEPVNASSRPRITVKLL